MTIPIEIQVNGTGAIFKGLKAMNEMKNTATAVTKAMKDSVMSYETAMKKAEKFTSIDNIFGKLNSKIQEFTEKQDVFNKLGGRAGIFAEQLSKMGNKMADMTGITNGLGTAMKMFSGSMKGSLLAGQGLFASLKAGFGTLRTGISAGAVSVNGLIASFAALGGMIISALLPIAAIGAAIYSLKKIWDLNLGGIQTKFNAVVGQLRTIWAKFNIVFIKTLRKFEPFFKGVFSQIFGIVKNTIGMMIDIFAGLYAIIEPIIDVFSEIFNIFGSGNSEVSAMSIIFKILGKVLLGVGKILGFVIRVGLIPLSLAIKGLNFLWKEFVKSFKSSTLFLFIMKLKDVFVSTFSIIKDTINSIWDYIVGIIDKIPNAFLPKSLESLKTNKVSDAPGVAASSQRSISNNINNNQQLTFNTSTPTSPDQTRAFAQRMQQQLINGY